MLQKGWQSNEKKKKMSTGWKSTSRIRWSDSQLQHGHSQCAQFREVLPQSLCVPEVVLVVRELVLFISYIDIDSRKGKKNGALHNTPRVEICLVHGVWSHFCSVRNVLCMRNDF